MNFFLLSLSNFNIFLYVFGAFVEVVGFAILFNKNIINSKFIKQIHIFVGILLVLIGYGMALSARGGN